MPLVVFVGLPGAGKSTVSRRIRIRSADRWTPMEWSIDDILEIQCPVGEAEFSGTRLYVRDGSYFMMHPDWRAGQMRRATHGLVTLARQFGRLSGTFARPPLLLLEIPTTELANFREMAIGQPDFVGILVLLHASRASRLRRNSAGELRQRLPDSVLEYFETAAREIDTERECQLLRDAGWTLVEDETEGELSGVVARVAGRVEQAIAAQVAGARPGPRP